MQAQFPTHFSASCMLQKINLHPHNKKYYNWENLYHVHEDVLQHRLLICSTQLCKRLKVTIYITIVLLCVFFLSEERHFKCENRLNSKSNLLQSFHLTKNLLATSHLTSSPSIPATQMSSLLPSLFLWAPAATNSGSSTPPDLCFESSRNGVSLYASDGKFLGNQEGKASTSPPVDRLI